MSQSPSVETVTLHDPATGSTARILAGFGFNCFSFQAVDRGEPVELLWSAPGFETGGGRASSSGIPLLFPFAGRIRGGAFEYAGRKFELPLGDGRGNAIHGFVLSRPWTVVDATTARVTGRFQASRDEPSLLAAWPADFAIQVTYTLAGNALRMELEVQNPDDKLLPFGFGTHPYFRVPLGAGGAISIPEDRANDCLATVPVAQSWELAELLPTGNVSDRDTVLPKLSSGMRFGDTAFDSVFGGLAANGGIVTASIHDPATQRKLVMTFDDSFRYAVVYNPPHRQALCIEPYTCLPNPFFLGAQNIETGLRELVPGQSFRAQIEMRLEAATG